MLTLFSIVFWSYLLITSLLFWVIAIILFVGSIPFDPKRQLLHRFTCWWAYHYVQINPLWQVQFEGLDNIDSSQTYIITPNHQSLGDILVIFGLKIHFKWVSKAEVFKVPLIGWNMRLNNYVALDRGNKSSIESMLVACETHLYRGSSIAIFPEGTRSQDGNLLPFKTGAFRLAIKTKMSILPVIIDGTTDALPKSGWVLRNRQRLHVRVRILAPMLPISANEDANTLSHRVRNHMIKELESMRRTSDLEQKSL